MFFFFTLGESTDEKTFSQSIVLSCLQKQMLGLVEENLQNQEGLWIYAQDSGLFSPKGDKINLIQDSNLKKHDKILMS